MSAVVKPARKPTPGPWAYDPDDGVVTSPSGPIAFLSRQTGRWWRLGLLREVDANARAIAALPELAESLQSLCNEVNASLSIAEMAIRQEVGNTNFNCILRRLEQARAVLVKAGYAP